MTGAADRSLRIERRRIRRIRQPGRVRRRGQGPGQCPRRIGPDPVLLGHLGPPGDQTFGHAQAIRVTPDGLLAGAADPRSGDGALAGR
jgi:hypothetical protein